MVSTQVIQGDCIEVMRGMEAGSVQCVVTSPPYWGLRDYGTAEWEGGDEGCEHKRDQGNIESSTLEGGKGNVHHAHEPAFRETCSKCGARRIDQQLGLEPTPEAYIAKMVEAFWEVRRVLRDDGMLWLNVGDAYATGGGFGRQGITGALATRSIGKNDRQGRAPLGPNLKPKDLIGMPWRLALALQADGWWLRSAMPWVKRSAMPESCRDRPTSAIEYVFLLTKSARYFWDAEAVRVKHAEPARGHGEHESNTPHSGRLDTQEQAAFTVGSRQYNPAGRNFRNADLYFQSLKPPHGMIFCGDEAVGLDVNPEPFKKCHFATFPRKLVEPLVKAGTSEKGCCPECGAPWRRILEKAGGTTGESWHSHGADAIEGAGQNGSERVAKMCDGSYQVRTIGWHPGCMCELEDLKTIPEGTSFDPVPCTVFDPFCGSGTVGVVAKQHERNFIGIELNPDYCKMAEQRIANPEPEPEVPDAPGQMTMFEEAEREYV